MKCEFCGGKGFIPSDYDGDALYPCQPCNPEWSRVSGSEAIRQHNRDKIEAASRKLTERKRK